MILLLGDSWSSDCLSYGNKKSKFYNESVCLRTQIERATGVNVTNLSRQGASQTVSLVAVEHTVDSREQYHALVAATDCFRQLPLKQNFSDYNTALAWCKQDIKDSFNRLARSHPNIKWYHWGGQNCVWYEDCLPSGHTILYKDYAHECWGTAASETGLHTWWNNIHTVMGKRFPNTSKRDKKYIIHKTMETMHNRFQRRDLFEDGGHLNWQNYDQLVQRFVAATGL